MSGRWSAAIFTTCPKQPAVLPQYPIQYVRTKVSGLGVLPNRKVPSWDPVGGFKLIWGRFTFIFPTKLSFSPDQNLYPRVLTAGIEGSNQNARDLRAWNAHHTQLRRCAGLERNAATNVEPSWILGPKLGENIDMMVIFVETKHTFLIKYSLKATFNKRVVDAT